MTRTSRQLLDDVLALPESERLEIAAQIIARVNGQDQEGWDEAWLAELKRRSLAASERSEPSPEWAEVRPRLLARLAAQ